MKIRFCRFLKIIFAITVVHFPREENFLGLMYRLELTDLFWEK